MGTRGMVASPHYLATGAGLNVLRRGGSAIDAAIAVNSVLAVVTPTLCGIGGDLFALVYEPGSGEPVGINGSGRAPAEATVERVRELSGGDTMPVRGPLTITVPGCVEAWQRLHDRFGRLPLATVLEDAIFYADHGFPVSESFARAAAIFTPSLHPDTPARETFLPAGRPLCESDVLRQPRLARTLRAIAEGGAEVYYRGWIGQEIARTIRAIGGVMAAEDIASHTSDWVRPLSVEYRGYTIFELPPNSQGIVALLMLTMLGELPPDAMRDVSDEYVHVLAEAARLAYADRDAHVTDPDHMTVDPEQLLSPEHARERVVGIGSHAGRTAVAGTPGDTAYMAACDGDGMLVSLIESNYMGIGSGVMGGESGIMLQNRGAWFSLKPDHINVIAPRKRTMHTLMPAMGFRNGAPAFVFGTMGGSMQPQIHAQLLTRLIDQELPPDEAVAAPRFDAVPHGAAAPYIGMESRFDEGVVDGLRSRGHDVRLVEPYASSMGHAHVISINGGVYTGASDPRTESLALGF
ncbi:MAG TPA: gamma-glutamyltransferase [Chloroflexota bacterium]|nr:gamma-glutamyltransferase [Chloroflexota bacterium]